MDSAPAHRERLVPPWWMLLVLLLIVPAALLVFLPVSIEAGIVVAVVLYTAVVLGLWLGAPIVELREGQLRAGRARIDVAHLGSADVLHGPAAKSALRGGWNPADHHVVSPWTTSLVRVQVEDVEDPTPAWVISTRKPEQLVVAIATAQATA